MKTVGDLREVLKGLPDDMEVVGADTWDEKLEVYSVKVGYVVPVAFSKEKTIAVIIGMETPAGDYDTPIYTEDE